MTEIVRTQRHALVERQAAGLTGLTPSRSLRRRTQRAVEDGIVASVTIEAAGYATSVALSTLASVSTHEAHVIQTTPAEDPIHKERIAARARAITDVFTGLAVAELRDLA